MNKMYLLTLLSIFILNTFDINSETIENKENELILEYPVRSLIGILALPARNRRQNEATINEFEDEGIKVNSDQLFVIGLPEADHGDKVNFEIDTLRSPDDLETKRKKRSPVFAGGVRCIDCGMTGGTAPIGGMSTMEGGRSRSWSQSSSTSSSGSYGSDYGGTSQGILGRK